MNMKMTKITRTDSLVRFVHELTLEKGSVEERDITAHEAPMKSFDDALQGLAAVAAKVLELPPEYAAGISVHSLAISYTKAGTRTATIYFKKALDATSTNHAMATPGFQIDDAGEGEEGRRQCAPKHAERVATMIEEAEKYAEGERQQMQLPLGETKKKDAKEAGGTLALFPEGRSGDPEPEAGKGEKLSDADRKKKKAEAEKARRAKKKAEKSAGDDGGDGNGGE